MKRLIVIIQVILLVGFTSCSKDFLTKEPPAVAGPSALLNSTGVEATLVAVYASMRGNGAFGGAMATDWTYGSAASDDAYKGSEETDQSQFNDVELYKALPNNPYMAERWRDCYQVVARANTAMTILKNTQAGATPISEERAAQVEAEIKFLRAWGHFQAQKIFRNIPYVMTADEMDGLDPTMVPNTGPVWDDIERDLQFAIDNLPESFPGAPGRADSWAAKAVKAHAHMYQNELAQAKTLLDDIINNGGFTLVDDYYANFSEDTENNSESIFEIQATTSAAGHTGLRIAQPVFPQAGGPAVGGWGFYQPSQTLVDAFQVTEDGLPILDINDRVMLKNDFKPVQLGPLDEFIPTDQLIDPRLDWTVTRRGVDVLGWGVATTALIRVMVNGGPYMTKKYLHLAKNRGNQGNTGGSHNERNFRMYRLSHILLWRAEVAVEDNELDRARELVNMIRNRANHPEYWTRGVATVYTFQGATVPAEQTDMTKLAGNYKVEPYPAGHAAFASQTEARKAVRMEIQLEFATEGHRFFDLRRWGIISEVLNDFIIRDRQFRGFMRDAQFEPGKDEYWPVPLAQIELQPGIITQDPNY